MAGDRVRFEGVRVETRVPRRARAGDAIPVTLVIRIEGREPKTLHFRGRTIVFDIVVEDAGGRVIWRRLEGATAFAILRVETLASGRELVFTDKWPTRARDGSVVAPGEYLVHGEFPSDAAHPLRTPPAAVQVVAR